MRRLLIAGNWKMHGSMAMVGALVNGILAELDSASDGHEVAVFPPFPYLLEVRDLATGSALAWGGQDLNPNPQGAHTGEVSADMLVDLDCRYVLVGHSERRQFYGDSDGVVAAKFERALSAGLRPVLCVGETLEERDQDRTEAVVEAQIDAVLEQVGIAGFADAVVAYEPVWAIGTGRTASPDQAQAVHRFIRDKLVSMDDTIGDQLRILYGGSMKADNAGSLLSQPDIDGGLIGGASLQAESFLGIVRAANKGTV